MPDSNVQAPYVPSKRYGKERREIEFSRTLEFHRITKGKMASSVPIRQNLARSIDRQIKAQQEEKLDP